MTWKRTYKGCESASYPGSGDEKGTTLKGLRHPARDPGRCNPVGLKISKITNERRRHAFELHWASGACAVRRGFCRTSTDTRSIRSLTPKADGRGYGVWLACR